MITTLDRYAKAFGGLPGLARGQLKARPSLLDGRLLHSVLDTAHGNVSIYVSPKSALPYTMLSQEYRVGEYLEASGWVISHDPCFNDRGLAVTGLNRCLPNR